MYKAVAWRDRDRVDVERLLALHTADIDLTYVWAMLAQFAELLEEPDRLRDFDRLVAQSQSSG